MINKLYKKNIFFLIIFIMINTCAHADVTSVDVIPVGTNGRYIEATTSNNPVFHMQINADASGDTLTYLSVINSLNSWYIGAAGEPGSIAENSVKLWYYPVDTSDFSASSAQYVTHLPTDGGNQWYNNFNVIVSDGSGIWVTIDIKESPDIGSAEFQAESVSFSSGAGINISGEPSSPPVMLITQVTPAEILEVLHLNGTMQNYVSTSQENLIPVEFKFYNNSGPDSAAAVATGITMTVETYNPPGTLLAPDSIITSIKIQDKKTGTIYGGLDESSVPSAAQPLSIPLSLLNIPAETTVTASVIVKMTGVPSSAGTNFVFSLPDYNSLPAYDYYTYESVSIHSSPLDPAGFPMFSNFATIQKQAVSITADYNPNTIPANINKGQIDVPVLALFFTNPGDTNTASAEIHNINFTLLDNNDNPVVPSELLSKLTVTDPSGTVIYGVKESSSLESSGNTISFPLLNTVGVPAASTTTVVVKADINPSTDINAFKIGVVSNSDIYARDTNSFASSVVSPRGTMPYYSNLALLSSSFKISHTSKMPKNIYPGQDNINIMELWLTSPLSFGSGNLLVRGITFTAKNASGGAVDFSSYITSVSLAHVSATAKNENPPSGSVLYLDFPEPVTISASGESMNLHIDISENSPSGSLLLEMESSSHIDAYQDNEPTREIFITPDSGESFPMSSGIGYLSPESESGGLSFNSYPNPFSLHQKASFAYYLKNPSKVTIKIYDIMGNHIKTITDNKNRTAGSNSSDNWDGTDEQGRYVTAGTYIAVIETSGGKRKLTKVTFMK